MKCCTFFGHRECPKTVEKHLQDVLHMLVVDYHVDMFYVGNQGQFDTMVYRSLQKLKQKCPHIEFAVVLAYMPNKLHEFQCAYDTILPEGIEFVHPRYAITWRNKWMLMHSECVVTYVTHGWGGAAKWKENALRQGKQVFSLT